MKLLLSFVLLLFLVPVASAGYVGVNTRLCLDPYWPNIGECANDGGTLGSVTIAASGTLTGTTTDANGYGTLAVTAEGTAYLNATKSGFRNPGPTYSYLTQSAFNIGQTGTLTLYVYLNPTLCTPTNQTVTVPAIATWNYTVQIPDQSFYSTVVRRDPNTGQLSVAMRTNPLMSSYGNINFPFGGIATQNGTNGQLFNNTGAYALILSDSTAQVVNYCTAQIVTTGTTFTPINLQDGDNATIRRLIKDATENIQNLQSQASVDGIDFTAFVAGIVVGRPWFFPNVYYWLVGFIIIGKFIGPRRSPDSMREDAL